METAVKIGKNLLLALAVYFLIGGLIFLHSGTDELRCDFRLALAAPVLGLSDKRCKWLDTPA